MVPKIFATGGKDYLIAGDRSGRYADHGFTSGKGEAEGHAEVEAIFLGSVPNLRENAVTPGG